MAGKSTRYPNMRPKWLLTHPSGRFMAIEAIQALPLEGFARILFVTLAEHERNHSFLRGFREELDLQGLKPKAEILLLSSPTRDQPETVRQAITEARIDGQIFVKDSDNSFEADIPVGNAVCYADLHECGTLAPANKSYLTYDENGLLSNIVEKRVISPYFCVGGYSFSSAAAFTETVDRMILDHERYLSHVILQMLLQDIPFVAQKVARYKDWGTADDWIRYTRTYATLFVDIDGTLVRNSSSHFPPYIGNTPPLEKNVQVLRDLHATGRVQIILTSSRPERHRQTTLDQLKREGIPFDQLLLNLHHAQRVVVNDYSSSNPYPTCGAINLRRDSDELQELLQQLLPR